MIETLLSLLSNAFDAIGAAFLAVVLSVSSFFGYAEISPEAAVVVNPLPEPSVIVATSSLATASTTVPVPVPIPIPVPKKVIPAPVNIPENNTTITTVVVTTTTTIPAPPIGTGTTTSPVSTVSTSTPSNTIGTTTLAIQSVPLLVGGTVHAGGSVPVSYLQITNIGSEGAVLKGFWITQNGTAPGASIIGLSTVDDKGGSRGVSGGAEGSILFQNGLAFAPTDAFFAPGQMRLFTIKATMTRTVSFYVGMQLMIDVASIETTAAVNGQFPIRGTTWTIAE